MGDYADLLKAQTKSQSPAPKPREGKPVPNEPAPTIEPQNESTNVRTNERPDTTPVKRISERSNETPSERSRQRTFERTKIRHTFDIFADQLLSLRHIALERETVFGERVLLGDIVQEALDLFITKERNKE